MTLAELFARSSAAAKVNYANRLAYEATPEGKAQVAEREAHDARMRAADDRFALENPPNPFQLGAETAVNEGEREPPHELGENEAAQWLEGFDSENSDD